VSYLEFHIRRLRQKDFEKIDFLNRQFFKFHKKQFKEYFETDYKLTSEKFCEYLNAECSLVAVLNGEVIGFGCAEIKAINNETKSFSVLLINSFVIDDRYQGQGIGAKLLRHFETYAEKHNLDKVEVSLWANDKVEEFYLENGFTKRLIKMSKNIDIKD